MLTSKDKQNQSLEFIKRNCFGIVVVQEKNNGYINITKLAKAYQHQTGKRRDASEWLSNKRAQESINHLSSVTGIPVTELVEIIQGGNPESQGTFVHPKLALRFGIWLSDEFGYMVEQWFEEWVTGKSEKQSSKLSVEEIILLANCAAQSAQNAGVSKAVAESIKLDSVMQIAPEAKHLLFPQKNAIASANPLQEQAVTPTIIGQRLAKKLGLEKVSSRVVNKKLLQLGYQTSVTRIRKTTGKEVHDHYQPTEKTINSNYGQLEMTSYQDGAGKNTKYQLRWFNAIVEILAHNWETK